jgi:hypothetical protein
MNLFHRRTLFAFVLGAALATAVFVGRAAHATTNTINACFKPSNGTLYLLGEGTGRTECQPGDIPISWNTEGVNGQDGVSVTSQALAPGDANCPNGGSKFTAANGASYACNGSNGVDGQDGDDGVSVTNQALAPGDDAACPNGGTKFTSANGVSYACNGSNGQDGQDFSGTFTSPNGDYKLVVNDTTARLEGPLASVQITGAGVKVEGPHGALQLLTNNSSLTSPSALALNAGSGLAMTAGSGVTITSGSGLTMSSAAALNMNAANALTLHAQGLLSADSGSVTTIGGTRTVVNGTQQISLNGSNCGLLRPADFASLIGPDGGQILLNPLNAGSPTVRFGC